MLRRPDAKASPGYQVFMLALCLYSLGILAFQATRPTEPTTLIILDYADVIVCALFLADFVNSLLRAEDRWKYFRTWGWLDLVSSIPTVDLARWGRAARILRIFRVSRGLRVTQLFASLVMKRRAENAILAAALVALILVTFCSIAILHFESDPEANIKTAQDAVWWAFATITAAGFGDHFPVSSEGRLVGVLLMSAGVGLFGVLSGFLASWFMGEDSKGESEELVEIRSELERIRELLEQRRVGGGT
jgi:voltage-gated potassium channel